MIFRLYCVKHVIVQYVYVGMQSNEKNNKIFAIRNTTESLSFRLKEYLSINFQWRINAKYNRRLGNIFI